jgi:hypothetical protein
MAIDLPPVEVGIERGEITARREAMNPETCRSAREVLNDYLKKSKDGSVEADIAHNYAQDVVVLIRHGVYRGHDGLRELADMLFDELPNPVFEYHTCLVEGDVGFLEWNGAGDNTYVDDGADSYVIQNGKTVAQTIHYTTLLSEGANKSFAREQFS